MNYRELGRGEGREHLGDDRVFGKEFVLAKSLGLRGVNHTEETFTRQKPYKHVQAHTHTPQTHLKLKCSLAAPAFGSRFVPLKS